MIIKTHTVSQEPCGRQLYTQLSPPLSWLSSKVQAVMQVDSVVAGSGNFVSWVGGYTGIVKHLLLQLSTSNFWCLSCERSWALAKSCSPQV